MTQLQTETPKPKIAENAEVTRRYPEFVNTEAVLSYLKEIHQQVDQIAFNLRSTLTNIVSGNVQTTNGNQSTDSKATESSDGKDMI